MTIHRTDRKSGPYIGDGTTTVFPFAWKIFLGKNVRVVLTDAGGNEKDLTLDTDYKVVLNANQDDTPGGNVILSNPLSSSYTLTIISNAPEYQPMELIDLGKFYPHTLNDSADRIVILIQQLKEEADRAFKVPITDWGAKTQLPSQQQRENGLLGFDANGNPVIVPATDGSGWMMDIINWLANPEAPGYIGYDKSYFYPAGTVGFALNDIYNNINIIDGEIKTLQDGQTDLYKKFNSLQDQINQFYNNVGDLISSDSGNLIRLGSDGKLYYSSVITTSYFVDYSLGNDVTGDGSRDLPFKTLAHALHLIPDGTTGGQIFLKENDTHFVKRSENCQKNASIFFQPYGPQVDAWIAAIGPSGAGDFFGVGALGFQGAPLATIAPVADVEIFSGAGFYDNNILCPTGNSIFIFYGMDLATPQAGVNGSGPLVPAGNSNHFGTYTYVSGVAVTQFVNCNFLIYNGAVANLTTSNQVQFQGCTRKSGSPASDACLVVTGSAMAGASLQVQGIGLSTTPPSHNGYTLLASFNNSDLVGPTWIYGLPPASNSYPGLTTNVPTS